MSTKIILYADSNEKERRLYSKAMKGAGYSIMDFNKGQPLLEKLSVIEPRLVMLEIDLLQVDGLDICEHIRKIVRDKFPIIFFTRSDTISNLEQAIDAGGDDFLLKSSSANLLKRLQMWSQKNVRLGIAERRLRTKKRIGKLKEFMVANSMDGMAIAEYIDHVLGWEITEDDANGGLGDLASLADFNTPIDEDYYSEMDQLSRDTSGFFSALDGVDQAPVKRKRASAISKKQVKADPRKSEISSQKNVVQKSEIVANISPKKTQAPLAPTEKAKVAKVRKEPVLDKQKLAVRPTVKKTGIAQKVQPSAPKIPPKHRTMGIPGQKKPIDTDEKVWGQPSVSSRTASKELVDDEWEGTNALVDGVTAENPEHEDVIDFWDMLEDNDGNR